MQVEQIRHSIIDKLLSINSKELLTALNKILESKSEDLILLTNEQVKNVKNEQRRYCKRKYYFANRNR